MRFKLLFMMTLLLAATQGWANPDRGGFGTPVIATSIDDLDFGDVEVGYPVKKSFVVTGYYLLDDINLRIETSSVNYYKVTPQTITPEQAANGVTVWVTYSPGSWWWMNADLILTSQDAMEVDIPITANPGYPHAFLINNQEEQFTAYVGQIVKRTGIVRFADYEVPTDPTNPTVDRSVGFDVASMDVDGIVAPGYSLSIEGSDKAHFMAVITKASAIANVCTVTIRYMPHCLGTHEAVLKVYCINAGVPLVTIPLKGEAEKVWGDLDDDGIIGIGDVTGMIDTLLRGDIAADQGDMNGDGKFTIGDITLLIDRMLEVK